LALFGGRYAVDWDESPGLVSAVPAKVVTVGAPPAGLVDRVRFFGEEHREYVSYAVARGRREGTQ